LLNNQSYNPLKTRVHDILGGHFVSSPLALYETCPTITGPDGYAVNDHLD
jgi:hypothetical protein